MKKIKCPKCGRELVNLAAEGGSPEFWCDECGITYELHPDDETPVSVFTDIVRVDWYDAGEGVCGDYDPQDPDDIHLLRFDVYAKEPGNSDWEEVEDASYCTLTAADTEEERLLLAAAFILSRYEDALQGGGSVKKLGEELSWIKA